MGLFGKKKRSDVQTAQTAPEAKDALREAASDSGPKAILKALDALGKGLYRWFGLKGELHGDYSAAVQKAWREEEPASCGSALPSVTVLDWERWDYPMMKHLWEAAEETDSEVLFIRTTGKRKTEEAFKELTALKLLSENPNTGMAVYCEENIFLRKVFPLETRGSLSPDAEEIMQDLSDYSRGRDMPVGDVW